MIDFGQPTALFGGSFDPLHEGHLHVARSVLAARPEIKQFVFIPAFRSPGKAPAVASPEQRLAWLRAATEPAEFAVWDAELRRGGESFTVETLEALPPNAVRPLLILGTDAYASFPRWKRPERIRELARLLVVTRPGAPLPSLHPGDIALEIPPHPASSTEIRAQLAAGGKAPWLPAEVQKLLLAQNPYARN